MADTCQQCPEGMILKEGKCVLPEVTFETFVMSLNQAALCHLGELADPETGERARDLSLAKHTIDTLAMLREKTQGNLTEDEQRLLDSLLTDLRLLYVKAKG